MFFIEEPMEISAGLPHTREHPLKYQYVPMQILINDDQLRSVFGTIAVRNNLNHAYQSICMDTRLLSDDLGSVLFFAIGTIHHIDEAIRKGAEGVVYDKPIDLSKIPSHVSCYQVNNALGALRDLAHYQRDHSQALISAITGSFGKTTVKEMVRFIFESYFKKSPHSFYVAPSSYNNHLGVPFSLSHLTPNTKHAILEVGTNNLGEIDPLTRLIHPHIGVITAIKEVHIGQFKDFGELCMEKISIINGIKKNGTLIIHEEAFLIPIVQETLLKTRPDLRILLVGKSTSCDVQIISYEQNTLCFNFFGKNNTLIFKTANMGVPMAINALFALTIASMHGVALEDALPILEHFTPLDGRGKTYTIKQFGKSFTFVNDSFNANYYSLSAAISNMPKTSRRIAVIGDMLELGERSIFFHEEIAKHLLNNGIDHVVFLGNYGYIVKAILKERCHTFSTLEDLETFLSGIIEDNDHVLFKASKGTGLYKLAQKLISKNT